MDSSAGLQEAEGGSFSGDNDDGHPRHDAMNVGMAEADGGLLRPESCAASLPGEHSPLLPAGSKHDGGSTRTVQDAAPHSSGARETADAGRSLADADTMTEEGDQLHALQNVGTGGAAALPPVSLVSPSGTCGSASTERLNPANEVATSLSPVGMIPSSSPLAGYSGSQGNNCFAGVHAL